MTADNAICIARLGNLFAVYIGFRSTDFAIPEGKEVRCWSEHAEAEAEAHKWHDSEGFVEYGVVDLTKDNKTSTHDAEQ